MRTILALPLALLLAQAGPAGMPRPIAGFTIERIATVGEARELAFAPNGDLFVGTSGNGVYLVRDADGNAQAPVEFATLPDAPAAGVAVDASQLYVGTQFGVYAFSYAAGQRSARGAPKRIAAVRISGVRGAHRTTSLALDGETLYVSVGSSCNACIPELDPTRATIQRLDLTTGKMQPQARRIRNAIALAIDPGTHALWAGVAGVDDLAVGHPYEIFDAVTLHPGVADYGWPSCYEDRRVHPKWPADCSHAAVPRVVFPAYETPIGAVFYPARPRGRYAFPAKYRGGAFVTLHGSWHGPAQGLSGFIPPRVVFVPTHGDTPDSPVDWNDPNTQWTEFVGGYQLGGTASRIGRPTGIAVGPQGSLFVADDQTGAIYRIRPR